MELYSSYLLLTDNNIYPNHLMCQEEDFEVFKGLLLVESAKYERGKNCIYFIRQVGVELAIFACKDGQEIIVPPELQKRLDTERRGYTICLYRKYNEPLASTCTSGHIQ